MHDKEASSENIWSTLLSEVHATAVNRLNAYGAYGSTIGPQIIILGSEHVGKSKLLSAISRSDDPGFGMGLEYHCMAFKEEQQEGMANSITETLQLGIWCLDGDPGQSHLLKFALNESNVWHTMLLVCVSLTEPWSMMSELQLWLRIAQQHVARLKLAPGELKALRRSIETQFKSYRDPSSGETSREGSDMNPKGTKVPYSTSVQRGRRASQNVTLVEDNTNWPCTPLHPAQSQSDEGAENNNEPGVQMNSSAENPLGVPLMIVVTKVDGFNHLEDEYGYTDEHFDSIQYHLRQLCLQYKASLIYTSTKEAINTDLLFRYLKHRLYGLPFSASACLIDPVAIFIPSGWDNEHRLELLRKNLPDSMTNEKFGIDFPRPSKVRSKNSTRGKKSPVTDLSRRADDSLILQTAEDEQTFLARMQLQLQHMRTPSPGDGSVLSKLGNEITSPISLPKNVPSSGTSGTCGSGRQQTPTNITEKEAVLSSFFNSLLTRKNLSNESTPSSSPAPPPTSGLVPRIKQPISARKASSTSSQMSQEPVGLTSAPTGDQDKCEAATSKPMSSRAEAKSPHVTTVPTVVGISPQTKNKSSLEEKSVQSKSTTKKIRLPGVNQKEIGSIDVPVTKGPPVASSKSTNAAENGIRGAIIKSTVPRKESKKVLDKKALNNSDIPPLKPRAELVDDEIQSNDKNDRNDTSTASVRISGAEKSNVRATPLKKQLAKSTGVFLDPKSTRMGSLVKETEKEPQVGKSKQTKEHVDESSLGLIEPNKEKAKPKRLYEIGSAQCERINQDTEIRSKMLVDQKRKTEETSLTESTNETTNLEEFDEVKQSTTNTSGEVENTKLMKTGTEALNTPIQEGSMQATKEQIIRNDTPDSPANTKIQSQHLIES
ncbi:Dynein light intermediate chain 1 cytosolic [Fasciola hepatica]|uniref:Dynein light intermediate chain 1 cytosolic n=1 Tax=Fasciola hepatica TaxID=6192 RepID=A0A4E0S081_FASHE|nr:Dynein light intermediate chain 1 cytosolic [Fasciola hepatica]